MRALALVVALLLGIVAAGCGGDEEAQPETGPSAATATAESAGESKLIGESNPHLSNPILQALHRGHAEAASSLGWEVRVLDAGLSPDKQVADLDTLISLGAAAITTWSMDPGAAEAAYSRAREAGIPLVGFNSESQFINTNVKTQLSASCEPFEEEAAFIAENIPNAKVLVIGGPPVPALRMRVECFTEAANEHGLTILDKKDNVRDVAATAQPIAQDMLTQHPDTQAIWAYNDPTALGASAALRSAQKEIWSGDTEGVIVIGNNADPDGIAAIKAGSLTLTYDENTFQAGVEAVKALIPVLRDGEPASSMPKEVSVEATRYDASNADDWVHPDQRTADVDS